jgi:hypothetical protein
MLISVCAKSAKILQSRFSLASAKVDHQAVETSVVELFALRGQANFDVAQTLAICELCEGHGKKLVQAGKLSHSSVSVVSFDAAIELVV